MSSTQRWHEQVGKALVFEEPHPVQHPGLIGFEIKMDRGPLLSQSK